MEKPRICFECGAIATMIIGKDIALCHECFKKHLITEPQVVIEEQKEVKMTDTQQKIEDITEGMKDLLLYKNRKYGDSALKPKGIFYKGDSTNSIRIRLDDKIGRIISNPEDNLRINDVADIIGYCTLLLISLGVTKEDLAKFKD